jgi:acyl-ACP thioesterase
MQESAWKHADSLGLGFEALLEQNLIWVLARQIISINVYPRWGDTITIHTWATGRERLFWYRDFKILNADRQQIGQASTAWFVINLDTRRPQRADSLPYVLPEGFERMYTTRPGKIPALKQGERTFAIKAGYRHLDVNQHVNNVKYIEWVLEGFGLAFHQSHILRTFEINYMSEAGYGDNLAVFQEAAGNLTFLHSLQRTDTAELCRAKTVWQPDIKGKQK